MERKTMTTTHEPNQSDAAVEPSVPSTHRCLELHDETVLVYDRENPERWIQSTDSVSPVALR